MMTPFKSYSAQCIYFLTMLPCNVLTWATFNYLVLCAEAIENEICCDHNVYAHELVKILQIALTNVF